MVELGTDARRAHRGAAHRHVHARSGLTAGNALEVRESVEVLAGGGPADVVELTVALAREMLAAAGMTDVDPADVLADGRRMDVWRRMIARPGRRPGRAAAAAPRDHEVVAAPADGVLTRLDAWPSASRPGGSAPAGPARRTRCRPPPASACTPSRATRCAAGRAAADAAHRRRRSGSPGRCEALAGAVSIGSGGLAARPPAARPRPDRLTPTLSGMPS